MKQIVNFKTNPKSKKTIHVFARHFYAIVSGLEINILNTYSNLVKKGWSITIHTTKNTRYWKNILPREQITKELRVKRYSKMFYAIKVFTEREIYEEGNLLVLHDLDISGQILIYLRTLVFKLLGFKKYSFIFSSHGLFNYGPNIYPSMKIKIRTFIQNSIGVFLINKCVDGIRAVSNFEKKGLVKAGVKESLIKVITNGLEEEAFKDIEEMASESVKSFVRKTGDYIIQVGRIDRVKNYEVAIRSLQKLPNDIQYVILGDERDVNYKRELLALIKSLGVEDRVVFLGVITGVDKYYLMKHSLTMVHLAKAEGFGNAVHEGMSQGLVCITSNRGNLPDLVKNGVNGYCLDPDDYERLAEKIKFVLENKNSPKILEIKKRNEDFAVDHSWQSVAEKVERFYLDILTQK